MKIERVVFKRFKAHRNFELPLGQTNGLVGPNNAGKSSILGAFRILKMALRKAGHRKPTMIDAPLGKRPGYIVPTEGIQVSLENVHTDLEEEPTLVEFHVTSGDSLVLYFSPDGGCRFYVETSGRVPKTPSTFRKRYPIGIVHVPTLGPVEYHEPLIRKEYVAQNLSTHRAARHFRNYWYHFPDGFDQFADMISLSWPGMTVEQPETVMTKGRAELRMICVEERIPRELYWAGFGFQVWCQLLSHLTRAADNTLLVVDEPETYLHPSLQARLVEILHRLPGTSLFATHSTEMIIRSDPSSLILVDKNAKKAKTLAHAAPRKVAETRGRLLAAREDWRKLMDGLLQPDPLTRAVRRYMARTTKRTRQVLSGLQAHDGTTLPESDSGRSRVASPDGTSERVKEEETLTDILSDLF